MNVVLLAFRRSFPILILLPFVCLTLYGCAGNGQGLDENGNPIGNGGNGLPVAFDPTFSNIQQNVFSAICIECHTGAAAPEGLRLEPEVAYQNLVGVASQEKPELLRVSPGDPDSSYLIHKLEGGSDIIGGQMPLDQPPLPQLTINAIRVWIAQGAPEN